MSGAAVVGLVALALSVLVLPGGGGGVAGRLAASGRTGGPDRPGGRRRRSGIARALVDGAVRVGRVRCASAAAGVGFGCCALAGYVAPGIAAAGLLGLSVQLAWSAADAVSRSRSDKAALEAVGALVDELRAGRPPDVALATVAAYADPALGWPLAAAAREAALGGDAAMVLGDCPDARLSQVAAGWALSAAGGCSLAAVLAAVDADLRAAARLERLTASQLSGPRATAGLLAILPVLGLAMGAAMGADPWRVLTATGPGQLALLLGVGLDILGVLWTVRITRVVR